MRITDVPVVLHERVGAGSATFGPRGGRQTRPGLGVGVDWPLINSPVSAVVA